MITGGSGLLALNWAISERDRSEVVLGLHRRGVNLAGTTSAFLSLDSVSRFEAELLDIRPDLVVHAAAMTDVEECESDPAKAFRINADLPKMIGVLCAKLGIPMVHISTDHLFSGIHAFASERREVSPQNVYGASKAEGERLLQQVNPHALIIRTNFYGWGTAYRHSFSDFVIENLRMGRRISLFTDVFFTPLLADALVKATMEIVTLGFTGLIHLVGDERISKYDFGYLLARHFDLDSRLIKAAKYSENMSAVKRPLDMSLSNALARQLLGRKISAIDEDMRLLRQQETAGLAADLREVQNCAGRG